MKKTIKKIREEAPANSVAGGGIAGLTSDPPMSLANQRKHKKRNKSILRRKRIPSA